MEPAAREPLLSPAAAETEIRSDTGRQKAKDTFWPCVANLSKVIIGAGMMAIPQAYCRIGSLAGTSMLVLVGVMTYTTLVFLLRGSAATGATTYSQLTQQLCGTAVMKVLQLAVLSFCFGFGVVYLVIIRDILLGTPPSCNGLLCELLGLPPSSLLANPRLVLIVLALLVCAPLLLLRTMDRLAALNVVGVAAIGMLALTALGLAFQGLVQGTAHPIPLWPQWQQLGHTKAQQLQALMAVMPVMIACYVAHQSLHPLMPLLQPFSDARMRRVIAAALMIAFAVFGSLAVGSSLAFGPDLEVNVLNNFSVSGLQPLTGLLLARMLSWAIRGGYLLSLLASLLLYMHPLRACLAEMLWPDKPPHASTDLGYNPGWNTSSSANSVVGQPWDEASHFLLHPGGQGAAEGSTSKGGARRDGVFGDRDRQQQGRGANDSSAGIAGRAAQQGSNARGDRAGLTAQPQQQQQRPMGSAFATPAAQAGVAAAAAAGGATGPGSVSSGGGAGALASSNSRQLTAFDSLDNPRTGSWSGVRYLSSLSPRVLQQQGGSSSGSIDGSSGEARPLPVHSIQHGQHHSGQGGPISAVQQQAVAAVVHVRDGIQIHVSDAGPGPAARRQQQHLQQQPPGALLAGFSKWREQEQQWYYVLTYGLLSAMVLVAIVVPNIWTALSAIGDLASTLQAFVVPGLIGIVLMRHTKVTESSGVYVRLQHVTSGGVGFLAVFLGLALFANGIYQRI